MTLPINQVVIGDCTEVMQGWPADSIDLVVTSPPYWGLRDYGSETVRIWGGDPACEHEWVDDSTKFGNMGGGEENRKEVWDSNMRDKLPKRNFCVHCGAWRGSLGLEPHPQLFIDHLVEICREIKRVLKPSGTFWLNLGDTYYGSRGNSSKSPQTKNQRILTGMPKKIVTAGLSSNWLQPKQKLMMPARVAIALQHDGWILRSDIIWHKPNHMPSSVKDRLTNAYEHVFLFAKARHYYFDLDAIRKPHQGRASGNKERTYLPDPRRNGREHFGRTFPWDPTIKGKNPGDVWSSSKYPNQEEERRLRRGIYQGKEFDLVTVRPNLPLPNVISVYLKQKRESSGLTIRKIAEKLGLNDDLVSHWFRTDEYFNYPSPSDWARLTEILSLDKYHEGMTDVETRSAYIEKHPRGKNPGDLWRIPTTPFPGAHFATFPPKLIEPIIKAGSPRWICSRCGKPRVRITEPTPAYAEKLGKSVHDHKDDLQRGMRYDKVLNAEYLTTGWSDCGCDAGWNPGVVLDPFGGSGTVGQVARRLGRSFILIEIIPEYCKMARQRVRGRYKPTPKGVVPLDQIMEAEK